MISRNFAATVLTVVGLFVSTASAADLSGLKVFPNPARVNRGDTGITFQGLTNAEVKIYNAAGRLVLEKTVDSVPFAWDLKNNDRTDVASGIYIYFVKSGGDERTGKLGVIR